MTGNPAKNKPAPAIRCKPILVAHRGYQQHFPENTLESIDAAYQNGIKHIEIDIQFSKDKQAMVYHDDSLKRVSGLGASLFEFDADQLLKTNANECGRLGNLYTDIKISSLSQVGEWLRTHPDVLLFIEIKPENLDRLSANEAVAIVLRTIDKLSHQCVIISFSEQIMSALNHYKQDVNPDNTMIQIAAQRVACGLVISSWTQYENGLFNGLKPDFVFCNYRKVPNRFRFDTDNWHWVLYEISNLKTLQRFYERGCQYFESFNAPGLLDSLKS
jgi:glycerophosphoryl diester phosphodiesterase